MPPKDHTQSTNPDPNAVNFGVGDMLGQVFGAVDIQEDKISADVDKAKKKTGSFFENLFGGTDGEGGFMKIIGFFISLLTGGKDLIGNLLSSIPSLLGMGGANEPAQTGQQQTPNAPNAPAPNASVEQGIQTLVHTGVSRGIGAVIGDIPLLNNIVEPLSNAITSHVSENFIANAPNVPQSNTPAKPQQKTHA